MDFRAKTCTKQVPISRRIQSLDISVIWIFARNQMSLHIDVINSLCPISLRFGLLINNCSCSHKLLLCLCLTDYKGNGMFCGRRGRRAEEEAFGITLCSSKIFRHFLIQRFSKSQLKVYATMTMQQYKPPIKLQFATYPTRK